MLGGGIIDRIRARGLYAKWQRPESFDRNLIVIGAGSAGLVSAYIAATVKAKVTLVEAHKMGGDCLNTGCVPSKALIRTARLAQQMREADRYGLEPVEPRLDFAQVMRRVHEVIARIEPHDSVERYTDLGVEVLQGYGKLVDPWTVEIAGKDGSSQRLTGRAIVIAAGAEPVVPPLPGIEDAGYVTTETVWDAFANLKQPPARLVVLGGGPVGCELAQAFSRLGSQVTLVQKPAQLLPREDAEVAACLEQALRREGIEVLTGHTAVRCTNQGRGKALVVEHEGAERALGFDALLCAVGRRARLAGYGLESLGIATEKTVSTNDYLQCLYPNIYAAGDVAGPFQFTHTASHQAWYAAVNALFGEFKTFRADYSVIPRVTYTDPEIAHVGLSESEAKVQGTRYEVTRYALTELDRAIAESSTEGFVKVLTVPDKDRILGVTIVGAHAGDLLAEFVLAMKHGLGLNKILGTIHSYPTWAEANKYAAGEWKRNHAPQTILRLLERYHRWKRR